MEDASASDVAEGESAANSTMEAEIMGEAVKEATALETLTARVSLPSLPQHRLTASTVLLLVLGILAAALFVLAMRRPVLRPRSKLPTLRRIDEWTPVARADANAPHADPPSIQLPSQRGFNVRPPASYSTFGDGPDGDAAWQAAKADWHAAIAAAKRLHTTGPDGEVQVAQNGQASAARPG